MRSSLALLHLTEAALSGASDLTQRSATLVLMPRAGESLLMLASVAWLACVAALGCSDVVNAETSAWARFATTGRAITAPAPVSAGLVVGITTRGAGALVDEHGDTIEVLEGDERDATCVIVRLDERGRVLWQSPVRAQDAQTRCTSVAVDAAGAIVARGTSFDVDDDTVALAVGGASAALDDDDAWRARLDDDGLTRDVGVDLDRAVALDACTPALSALASALEEVRAALDGGQERDGYLEARGIFADDTGGSTATLLAPQGTALDALTPTTVPELGDARVESVATIVRTH